jgi:hypothetical protein
MSGTREGRVDTRPIRRGLESASPDLRKHSMAPRSARVAALLPMLPAFATPFGGYPRQAKVHAPGDQVALRR